MARRRRVEDPAPSSSVVDEELRRFRWVFAEGEIGRHEDGGNFCGMAPLPFNDGWHRLLERLESAADDGDADAADLAERCRLLIERGYGWRTSPAWKHDQRSWLHRT